MKYHRDSNESIAFTELKESILNCRFCEDYLKPNPIIQVNPKARILIAGQAPGRIADEKNKPFLDASGDRLRSWLAINKSVFYNETLIAILPMGFCYPGKGKSGDLAPRKACADKWRDAVLAQLTNIETTIILGQYAQAYHLPKKAKNLTEMVKQWRDYAPSQFVLPHPSPRNQAWFKHNPWFEAELIPVLQQQIKTLLAKDTHTF